MVDHLVGSEIHNLKELRPASAGSSEIHVLFVFDPWHCAILLLVEAAAPPGPVVLAV